MLACLVRATEEGSRRALSEACTYLIPSSVGVPLDPYSHAVACETTICVAGQVVLDADNTMVGVGGPLRQAEQVWENIERVVEPAGGRVADVVEITVFLKDIRFGDAEIEVRRRLFSEGRFPICTEVQVANLATPEILMEVDAIAVI